MSRIKKMGLLVAVAAAVVAGGTGSAKALQFTLDTPFPGQPDIMVGYIDVEILDNGNSVDVNVKPVDFGPGQYMSTLFLNLEIPVVGIDGVESWSITPAVGEDPLAFFLIKEDAPKLFGHVKFDVQFAFNTSNSDGGIHRLQNGVVSTFTVSVFADDAQTVPINLNPEFFDAWSTFGGDYEAVQAAAHVQGLANGQSIKIHEGDRHFVPDASASVGLMGLAMLGLAALRARMR